MAPADFNVSDLRRFKWFKTDVQCRVVTLSTSEDRTDAPVEPRQRNGVPFVGQFKAFD